MAKKDIKKAYDEAIATIQSILGNFEATEEQRKEARQSLSDITSMMLVHTLETIEGRTALLANLIVELNQITSSIQTDSPLENIGTKLSELTDTASALLRTEKDSLV